MFLLKCLSLSIKWYGAVALQSVTWRQWARYMVVSGLGTECFKCPCISADGRWQWTGSTRDQTEAIAYNDEWHKCMKVGEGTELSNLSDLRLWSASWLLVWLMIIAPLKSCSVSLASWPCMLRNNKGHINRRPVQRSEMGSPFTGQAPSWLAAHSASAV